VILPLLVLLASSPAAAKAWPLVEGISKTYRIDTAAERIEIDLPVRNPVGEPLYSFWCRGGSTAFVDHVGSQLGIDVVPPFVCALDEMGRYTEDGLLSEDDSSYWYSRGQFQWKDLLGACGDYPEYGRVRTFRLRGLKLTLTASNVVASADDLRSFDLTVSIVPDPTAIRAQAERPDYLDPRGTAGCAQVRPGREPRMCRDWEHAGGSWGLCKDQD
jgi:hypothetical protein